MSSQVLFHRGLCSSSSVTDSSTDRQIHSYVCFDILDDIHNECEDEEVGFELEKDDEVPSLWQTILQESEEKWAPYRKWKEEQEASALQVPPQEGPFDYLDKEIFPILLPAMEDMLVKAKEWNALRFPKCFFNGLDHLAEVLWNRNPRFPERAKNWLGVFEIPPFKEFLRQHPRPIYPKSWLWSMDEAALIIQRCVRGWLVRKREDVQELRNFWKALAAEREEV